MGVIEWLGDRLVTDEKAKQGIERSPEERVQLRAVKNRVAGYFLAAVAAMCLVAAVVLAVWLSAI